jgi:uncharacterized protein YdeI (YjbR/CyaY-like superfamily)
MIPHVGEAMFFETAAAFRAWLDAHAATASELIVGYRRVKSGLPSMTWAESVDEALCHGWIDGIRRSLDETSYTIRFTPRRRDSRWSAVNVRRVGELMAEGRMTPAGLAAFEARRDEVGYTYEVLTAELPPEYEAVLRADAQAWAYWERTPPSYQRMAAHWVTSAKQEATRQRRLARLLDLCRAGKRL